MDSTSAPLEYASIKNDAPARKLLRWLLYTTAALGIPPLAIGVASLAASDAMETYGVFYLDALEWTAGILFAVGGAGTTAMALVLVIRQAGSALMLAAILTAQSVGLLLQGIAGILVTRHYLQTYSQLAGQGSSVALPWMQLFSPMLYWIALALAPLMLALIFSRPFVRALLAR